jgi:uncharacterized protein YjbI with pentapeptide repeats
VKFKSGVGFTRVQFKDYTDFTYTEFNKDANFVLTNFMKRVFFWSSFFKEQADFDRTKFNNVIFRNTYFGGLTRFIGKRKKSKSSERESLVFSKDYITDMRDVTFGQPEKVVFRSVYLGKCLFLNTNLTKIEIADVQWGKSNNRGIIYDEEYKDTEEGKNYALIEKVYSQLKKNLEDSRNYIYAGDFHYGEMDMKRKRHR